MKQLEIKKNNRNHSKVYKSNNYYEDEISETGKKGGRVAKERQQIHQIDLELRNYTYR